MSREYQSPVRLAANTVPSFYTGAGRIGRWRGDFSVDPTHPEDWVGSTERRTNMGDRGLTRLPSGRYLKDAIAESPMAWRGRSASTGAGVLLKLLDAGQRLPAHVHPDEGFAQSQLGLPNGKAEAWLVLDAQPDAVIHVGFSRDIADHELRDLVEQQDTAGLLALMNAVPVRDGDVIFCPPNVPHAIGAGILMIEVQEPSDQSIMLEWAGFPIDAEDRFLGLDIETALSTVDRRRLDARSVTGGRFPKRTPGTESLLPVAATPFFQAYSQNSTEQDQALPEGLSIAFILDGHGTLIWEGGSTETQTGDVWLVSASVSSPRLSGVRAVTCAPPSAAHASIVDDQSETRELQNDHS